MWMYCSRPMLVIDYPLTENTRNIASHVLTLVLTEAQGWQTSLKGSLFICEKDCRLLCEIIQGVDPNLYLPPLSRVDSKEFTVANCLSRSVVEAVNTGIFSLFLFTSFRLSPPAHPPQWAHRHIEVPATIATCRSLKAPF